MIRNYLKIAFRNLVKYKFTSFINIFGLTVGIACCLLILCYILNEVSYDRYHKEAANTYRVERTFLNPETKMLSLQLGTISPPFGPLLTNDFPEIKTLTRLLQNGNTTFKYDDKIFTEPNVYFADEHFFDVFSAQVTKGNPHKALNDPYSVMLTEDVARKYFGNEEPMNKMVRLDNQLTCRVTGVFKALPANSHFHPAVMISFNTLRDSAVYGEKNLRTNWGNNSFFTYIVLPAGYDPKKLEAQFPAFLDRHMGTEYYGRYKASQATSITLRKLTDIHLYAHNDYEAEVNGDSKRVYIFSAIALFILLIACINYMNLSTARSVLRAKEIGIRKVAGAEKGELIAQFLTESVLITWLAAALAFLLTALALPWLNRLSGQTLGIGILLQPTVIVPILLMPFITGFIAGIYPALFLSSFQPIRVLKGFMKVGGSDASFRRALVVVQFGVSIVLLIATTTVFRQLQYMQSMSLGFDKEQVVTLFYNNGLNKTFESFKTQLLADAGIKAVSRSSRIPSGRLLDAMGSQINRGDSLAATKADIKFVVADEDFIPTYGIRMVAGRNFSRDYGTDTASYLINEEAVRALGLRSNEEAIGKQFSYGGNKGTLIGVFADFHFEDLHQRIIPLTLYTNGAPNNYGNISIKITGNTSHALQHIETTWKKFLPETPYAYTFLNERFGKLYESEQKQGTIFTVFACIAVFIACLGLFGLSAFATTQRMKEIGIRKVLGADITTIVGLLSADFLKLVGIAALLAFPVAWYAMHRWLGDFAYRSSLPWWVFLLAGITAALVALVTISFQAIKAAMANPVKSLRSE